MLNLDLLQHTLFCVAEAAIRSSGSFPPRVPWVFVTMAGLVPRSMELKKASSCLTLIEYEWMAGVE